jgi:hypothetical protein
MKNLFVREKLISSMNRGIEIRGSAPDERADALRSPGAEPWIYVRRSGSFGGIAAMRRFLFSMSLEKITRKSRGWMLAETICCTLIALTVSACALEAGGAIAAISEKSRSKRMYALDYSSIIHEANARFESSPCIDRGEWNASVIAMGVRRGMKVAEILAVSSEGGENARWKRWKIDGRE